MLKKILDFFAGDELEHLDRALCDAYSRGKVTAEDVAAYNRHAYECKQAGIERKDWFEFFNRTTWR